MKTASMLIFKLYTVFRKKLSYAFSFSHSSKNDFSNSFIFYLFYQLHKYCFI